MDRVRHKEANRFKFIPFSERISNVRIDVFHRVPHRFEEESAEKFTYFHLAIQKWTVLNLTEKWKAFRKEIGNETQTLPQLINNKEKIIDVFLKNIRLQNELSLQPVLELIVALVKDLRYEFYPFYFQIEKELIYLLKFKDPDVLESTFTCLAYIFKYLSRELLKDLDKVLLDLATLLNENNPEYVRDFAAQSFSFIARKVKDKNKFLSLVLYAMQVSPQVSAGCGQLIFEMMKGIKGQTHSCAQDLFLVMLDSLGKNEFPQKTLFFLISHVVTAYGNNISPQHSILFDVLLKALQSKVESENYNGLKKLLKIIKLGLNCKKGAHLNEACLSQIVSVLIKLLSFETEIQKLVSGICADMLNLQNLKLPQEFTSRIINKVMQISESSILLDFIKETSNSTSFKNSILPRALEYFAPLDMCEFLQTLTKIIVNKTTENSKSFDEYQIYNLTLYPSTAQIFIFLTNILKNFVNCGDSSYNKNTLCALIIVRHIEYVERPSVVEIVIDIVNKLIELLKVSSDNIQNLLFTLCIALETVIICKNEMDSFKKINPINFLEMIVKYLNSDDSILALKSLDLFLKLYDNFEFYEKYYNTLLDIVQKWLLSSQSNFRLLALHVLLQLENSKFRKAPNAIVNVLQDALDAEIVPLTINSYREKIKLLEKLRFESLEFLEEEKHKLILKYLLGIFYCNFKLLWDPIAEIISSYSSGMRVNSFWEVFFPHLMSATENCKKMSEDLNSYLSNFDDFLVNSISLIKADDKVNHSNYRLLLWTTMNLFSEVCETKNKDVVTVFINFIEDNILKSSIDHNLTINIQQIDESNAVLTSKIQEKQVEDVDSEAKSRSSHSDLVKCAVAQLNLFSKFKNPKQCYRESDMRHYYLELIIHKDVELQKKALECLLNYKFMYLTPYKQNLRNLIDDVKFKDEIVHFQIDTESGIVKDIHREELMPLVMRILYGKMLSRSSTPRGNKGSANLLRRSVIIRFLAGSSHNEMKVFLEMAFKSWNNYCEEEEFPFAKIIESVDLEKVPPLKKLQSAVNLAEVVLNSFGNLMTDALKRYIFKVLLSVGSYVCGIFAQREKIHSGFLPSLRNLRNTCLDVITKFFDRFQKFPWKEDEINALFYVFIWPNLSKLPTEGVYSPTGLLKIFYIWSHNPRYFKLLARYHQADKSITPLPFLLNLLLNDKCHHSVTNYIGTILENLLTLQEKEPMEVDDEDFEEPVPLNVNFILPVDECGIAKLKLKDELNYGSKILFPYVGSILTYYRKRLEKSEFSLPQKEQVTVLSRITEMATSPEHADALLSMLLKLLSIKKQMGDDDFLVNIILTIDNLVKIVSKPSSYLKSLAILFGTIELVQARKILVNIIGNMDKRCPDLSQISTIVRELNAWDWKWVDQPNFDKRLDAFKKVKVLVEEDNLNIDLAFIILYNCFFFVRCETDLSLRDSASFCLKNMCPKVCHFKKIKPFQKLQWIENILNLTKKGIVSDNENIQTFSISLLGVMARECGDLHPVLKDLSLLTNKLDPEVDFFENAQHLQIYRRLKALQKFSSIAKTLKKSFLTRTLIQFILPLASRYLACPKYSGKNSLIDSAIEAVATICKFLPWQQYQTILRFFLTKLRTKLEFQKQLTRTVVAILDSFHFDISKSFSEIQAQVSKESNLNPVINDKKDDMENEKGNAQENQGDDQNFSTKDEENDEENATNESVQMKELEKDYFVEKDLAEVLEIESEVNVDEVHGGKEPENEKFAIDSIVTLSPIAATKVEKAISGHLLEQLYKIISQKSQVESTHKINYKSLGPDKDEEDVLKIPVAVTLVKLLQKLPERMLETQLPGIFMRLCTFLKSRVESVRRVTRETLQQILFSLGPKYLPLLLEEMSASLTKGFQVHVLVYTIHAVIQHIQDLLRPGDIDDSLPVLLEMCKSDLFGNLSEEKLVPQLQAQHKETKATKSYHLIHLIARCLTEKCLTDLILPVREVLQNSYSHKNILKCREYLRQVTQGLSVNQFITNENLFIYIYGTTSESIPQLMPDASEPPKKKNPKEKPDCFIIPPEPKSKMGVSSNPVKKSTRAKAHVIIEFGFSLLHTILKKDKLKNSDQDIRSYLDPISPVLIKALESQQVKVSTLALQCFSKIIKYDLPSIKSEVKKITDSLFLILHKYAAAGLCKGDNFDLVMAAFKAISTLIRETDYHGITTEQLKILLLYTEQDIYDTTRQATAFTLLKTILRKKLNSPELHELMKKVAALSITSELPHIRLQSRQNVLLYIMDYPLKSKLEDFIGFFISQLNFEVESGRQSTLEMIQSFITSFPQNVLEEHSGVFLLTLGARLLNDDSTNCKKMISGIIKAMLTRLDSAHKDQLFEILIVWLQAKKLPHRQLAAQIAGIFVSIEKKEFEKRLPILLPLLQKQFMGDSQPGQFVKVPTNDEEEDRLKDHYFFQILQLLLKICSHYPEFLTSEKYQDNVYFFTEIAQSLLCHAHEWIRFAAAQFLGHVFNSCEPGDVTAVLNGKNVESKLSFLEPITIHRRIKSLILDHTSQFIPGVELGQEFLDQIIKNLVYLGRVLKDVKNKKLLETKEDKEEDIEDEDNIDDDLEKRTLSLLWLIKRMRRVINMELGQCPSSNFLRTAVIRWIGAIALCIPRSDLRPVLYHIMAPVVREREIIDMETKESSMKPLVMEVSGVLKKKIGVEEYSREAVKIRSKLMEKRVQRRNQRAQEYILDPERAAKRKIDRQIRKKEARKRKLEQLRRNKGNKFKRRKKNNDDDDI